MKPSSLILAFIAAACGTGAKPDAGDGVLDSGWTWPADATRFVARDDGDFFNSSVCDTWTVELDGGVWALSRCRNELVDGGVVRRETTVDSGVLSTKEREQLVASTSAIREWTRLCSADERALKVVVETPDRTTTGWNAADFCGERPGVVPMIGLPPLFDVLRALGRDGG